MEADAIQCDGKGGELHACMHACRRAKRDDVQRLLRSDGSIDFATDNTSQPLPDTRVWLHMYEGEKGLQYTFCKETGAAHYMYDFIGFSDWRVEQNALLSDVAKCLMFRLWSSDRELWSEEVLAGIFKVRVQRALAIVKIKEEEFAHVRPFPHFCLGLCLCTARSLACAHVPGHALLTSHKGPQPFEVPCIGRYTLKSLRARLVTGRWQRPQMGTCDHACRPLILKQ
jgi:hypothetical protein